MVLYIGQGGFIVAGLADKQKNLDSIPGTLPISYYRSLYLLGYSNFGRRPNFT